MKKVFFIYSFLFAFAVQAQIKHVVAKGESVYQIAKKYQVTPYDIYRLNPDAENGIQENTTLLIPKAGSNSSGITHKVVAKETLFSISKKYNVAVSDIEKWNKDTLHEGLKIGQEIYVSKPSATNKTIASKEIKPVDIVKEEKVKTSTSTFSHTVVAQETKYGIATKYGLSVEELEKLNPQIVEGLKVGEILKIKTTQEKKVSIVGKGQYEVQPKETLFLSLIHI